jgi:hypothetical protein
MIREEDTFEEKHVFLFRLYKDLMGNNNKQFTKADPAFSANISFM